MDKTAEAQIKAEAPPDYQYPEGQPVTGSKQYPQYQQGANNVVTTAPMAAPQPMVTIQKSGPASHYLAVSIITTIFCCPMFPLGCIAIAFSFMRDAGLLVVHG